MRVDLNFRPPAEALLINLQNFSQQKALSGQKLGKIRSEEFLSLSWKETVEQVAAYCQLFQALGLKSGDRVALQARNQISWVLADWAMMCSGIVSVPIYVQSVEREVEYILKESNVRLILCEEISDTIQVAQKTLLDFHLSAQKFLGSSLPQVDIDPDAISTIIYTSGTTGTPKGVMHTLRSSFIAIQAGINHLQISEKDQLLSYLPLSHIAERMLCNFLPLYSGASVSFVESAEKVSRVIPIVKPTLFLAVPRVWDMMASKLRRELEGNSMLQVRLAAIPKFFRSMLLSVMVKRKLGFGRTRFFFSGAAKLHRETAEYLSEYGIRVAELYGLTETLGVSIFSDPKKPIFGSVGRPYPGVELKFAEDGEICLKADFHFKGYYNKPDETNAVLKDGWFHTGDIGRVDENGLVFITDRKKDIFKTANGKYVAPLPIESMLKSYPAIREVMVVGENRAHCVAIASIDENFFNADDLARHLERVNANLPIHERIKTLGCVTRAWSVEEGELTPTLKLKRAQLVKRYSNEIERLYDARKPVEYLDESGERKMLAHSRF